MIFTPCERQPGDGRTVDEFVEVVELAVHCYVPIDEGEVGSLELAEKSVPVDLLDARIRRAKLEQQRPGPIVPHHHRRTCCAAFRPRPDNGVVDGHIELECVDRGFRHQAAFAERLFSSITPRTSSPSLSTSVPADLRTAEGLERCQRAKWRHGMRSAETIAARREASAAIRLLQASMAST